MFFYRMKKHVETMKQELSDRRIEKINMQSIYIAIVFVLHAASS